MISSDAKCKVSVGEPGTPIASVSRGERVIVGVNQTLQVSDHDYSKISFIPDATLYKQYRVRIPGTEANCFTALKTWPFREALP